MGDIKMCSFCGSSMPAEAVFCPNCGQKQETLTKEPEQTIQTPEEPIIADVNETTPDSVSGADSDAAPEAWDQPEQVTEKTTVEEPSTVQQSPVYTSPAAAPQQQQPVYFDEEWDNTPEDIEIPEDEDLNPENYEKYYTEVYMSGKLNIDKVYEDIGIPVETEDNKILLGKDVNFLIEPSKPEPQKVEQPYAQSFTQSGYQQPTPAQSFQQPSYPAQAQQPAVPKMAKKKKKFPWVFTILWIAMLAFIGIWVYLWTTYPSSENPINTILDEDIIIDVIRVMVPVISAILLIYTLFLKLAVKKLKVVPTILLIIFFLLSAFMFLSFELVEGDWAHDLISPVTETIFQDLF